jgi:hypothetical protein
MTASMTVLDWWLWPSLILCAWWWADRSFRWTWIVSIEQGAIGAQWAYLGAYALAAWPTQLVIVGTGWIGYALVLATASWIGRRHAQRDQPYRGY